MKPGQYVNIFHLENEEDFNCYKEFFINKLKICPKYFKHSFDSFVLNKYETKFVERETVQLNNKAYIILDNSLSKKDLGIFEESDSDWQNVISFELKNFEDYKKQATSGKN
jgi:hypothetical protein